MTKQRQQAVWGLLWFRVVWSEAGTESHLRSQIWQNNDRKPSEAYSDLEWCGVRQELSLIWEAKKLLNNQEIHWNVWSLNVHYHVQKSPLLVFILIKVNPVHSAQRHFIKNQL